MLLYLIVPSTSHKSCYIVFTAPTSECKFTFPFLSLSLSLSLSLCMYIFTRGLAVLGVDVPRWLWLKHRHLTRNMVLVLVCPVGCSDSHSCIFSIRTFSPHSNARLSQSGHSWLMHHTTCFFFSCIYCKSKNKQGMGTTWTAADCAWRSPADGANSLAGAVVPGVEEAEEAWGWWAGGAEDSDAAAVSCVYDVALCIYPTIVL